MIPPERTPEELAEISHLHALVGRHARALGESVRTNAFQAEIEKQKAAIARINAALKDLPRNFGDELRGPT